MTTDSQPAARTVAPPLDQRKWRDVLWDVSDSGILSITLNRPEHLNALTFRLLREITQLIETTSQREKCRRR